eukprot:4666473-Alexandrium_andersonii.AAC.1
MVTATDVDRCEPTTHALGMGWHHLRNRTHRRGHRRWLHARPSPHGPGMRMREQPVHCEPMRLRATAP